MLSQVSILAPPYCWGLRTLGLVSYTFVPVHFISKLLFVNPEHNGQPSNATRHGGKFRAGLRQNTANLQRAGPNTSPRVRCLGQNVCLVVEQGAYLNLRDYEISNRQALPFKGG
jgi:hypothetical protein